MSLSTPFIHRPVATTLLSVAVLMAGALAYRLLPVNPLPQVDFPTISVSASLPGASPETMASSVATPLERQFGRIADITEMTSSSSLGSTNVVLQFDLSRDIDAAARDVQAAINAARGNLPAGLPSNPTYNKINPADAPILILAITSDTSTRGAMYDIGSSVLAQKLSQVEGVGQVRVGGGALPAVRVDVNPTILNNMGLGLEDVSNTLSAANANAPKGVISGTNQAWTIATTDQLLKAADYKPLIVAYRNGAAVRVEDIANVTDSVEDVRTGGLANGKPAVLLIVSRQPGANIIDTVDRVLALVPQMQAEIPAGMTLAVVMDRTPTVRASVRDTEYTLLISTVLVILVVFFFLRDWRSTLIPSVAVPISLIGTFGVMYLLNYSIDNLSLMALTIATGFVVDDAIVVIENITRHVEAGKSPLEATLQGAREIGFTVLSMSTSLIAVFIPILLMNGFIGRLFREFAMVLSVAIAVSLLVSLTTTPMMCALFLQPTHEVRHGRIYNASEWVFNFFHRSYEQSLRIVLKHPLVMILVTLGTMAFTAYLYVVVPKGFLPQQDTGRASGSIQADQDTSFQAMSKLMQQYCQMVAQDPAVDGVIAFTGGGGRGGGTVNTGNMFVTLKPISERKMTIDQVDARLTRNAAKIPGGSLLFRPAQDINIGGRNSRAQYQYTLQGDNLNDLIEWAPKVQAAIHDLPGVTDVNSDQQNRGLEAYLQTDRATAQRLGVSEQAMDTVLGEAFGQSQVSTMYTPLNQYHVVMEVEPSFGTSANGLRYIYVPGANGVQIPLAAFTKYEPLTTSLQVNHQSQFPAITLSFNLVPGVALGQAVEEINKAEADIGMPATIHGSFQGTAQQYQAAQANQPLLIAAAILAVYLVLGMLYESFIHPITILSTLPSAGVGALMALIIFKTQLDVMGMIGIILLIGIVKKNAIMMIDFALMTQRAGKTKAIDAIFEACLLRFRPIMMTTMAALLGGLPLAIGMGTGSELRRPLGIAIVGGLIFSQMLTLYTTPVVYLYLDRFRTWIGRAIHGHHAAKIAAGEVHG